MKQIIFSYNTLTDFIAKKAYRCNVQTVFLSIIYIVSEKKKQIMFNLRCVHHIKYWF